MQKLRLDHGGFIASGTAEGLAATRVIQREYLGSVFAASCTNMINVSSKLQMFVLSVTIWWKKMSHIYTQCVNFCDVASKVGNSWSYFGAKMDGFNWLTHCQIV